MRTEDEIRTEMDAAYDVTMQGGSRYPGMTYEEGVAGALGWALGETDDAPMSDD